MPIEPGPFTGSGSGLKPGRQDAGPVVLGSAPRGGPAGFWSPFNQEGSSRGDRLHVKADGELVLVAPFCCALPQAVGRRPRGPARRAGTGAAPGLRLGLAGATLAVWTLALCAVAPVARGNPQPVASDAPGTGEAAPVRFFIREYQVRGNHQLSVAAVERALFPHMGPGRSIETVEAARVSLEQAYRDAGYETVLVNIPPQDVVGGVVRLEVVEGQVTRLRVRDARYFLPSVVKAEVPELAEGRVPHMPTAQRQLARAQAVSLDRRLVPVLRPGAVPGALEVDLRVRDKLPFHGRLELNGRNSAHTSRLRASANFRYDNLWQAFHSASLQVQFSPQQSEDVRVISGSYVVPVGDRARAVGYALRSESEAPVAAADALASVGAGDILGFRWVQPVGSGRTASQSVGFGLDFKDFEDDVVLVGADNLSTPIQYLPWTLEYSWVGLPPRVAQEFRLAAHGHWRGLVGEEEDFRAKRFRASASYLYLTADWRARWPLGNWDLVPRLGLQWADAPLINKEQISAGGSESVRGYYESQQLGDQGLVAGLALETPVWPASGAWATRLSLRGSLFAEGARLWVQEPLPGTPARSDLASVGVALRGAVGPHVELSAAHAVALENNGTIEAGDVRSHFSLAWRW